jgi:hypothetical protein
LAAEAQIRIKVKILLVSSSILPKSGGSSVIVENLARNFNAQNMVVLGSSRPFQKNNLNRSKTGPRFKYFFSELTLFGRGARFFDWFRKLRFKPLVETIKKVIQEEKITHVIGVYPNIFYCLASLRAAKELGLPFSSYFHNTYVENKAISDINAQKYQSEIFETSEHIFVMSDGMSTFYEDKYKLGKFVPLVHTFDKQPDTSKNTGLPGEQKNNYKLVAIGNFNESNIEATSRFIQAISNNPKYSLSIYTHVPNVLLQSRGLDTASFEHMGSVHPDEIHDIIQQYDICIITHGFTGGYGEVEYKTIFPTRTIPILLSGKPIFAHSPKGSFLNTFLKEHSCAELVDTPQITDIINGLDRIADSYDHQQKLVSNASKAVQLFYGPNVTVGLLNQLINSNSK